MSLPTLHGSMDAVGGCFLLQGDLYTMRVLQGTELSFSSFFASGFVPTLQ
jgi:hypothetical protein